uniref:C-type lectin domain-containing protein n=1 Tax=Sphaeramia orbicularis TaxID=375764 RepID=A0A673BHM6_9TELE
MFKIHLVPLYRLSLSIVYVHVLFNTVTITVAYPTAPCPPEWMMFQDRCYLLSSITGPWETGNQDCRARGAHLMIINSTEEQVQCIILSLMKLLSAVSVCWRGWEFLPPHPPQAPEDIPGSKITNPAMATPGSAILYDWLS